MPPRPPRFRPPVPVAPQGARDAKARTLPERDGRRHSRARGYDRTWERLRRMHLNAHPYCVRCEALGRAVLAKVADHVIPIAVDPTRRLDPSNLQSLCEPHHNSDKQREDRRAAKAQAKTGYETLRVGLSPGERAARAGLRGWRWRWARVPGLSKKIRFLWSAGWKKLPIRGKEV